MASYHINPKTGNPGKCRAVKSCPFGDLKADHYSSKESALEAFENAQKAQTVPAPAKRYSWPEKPETRTFTTARGEVMLQISGRIKNRSLTHKMQAWLTVPGEGNVAFIDLMAHDEDYYETLGEHLSMCDIETRVDARKKGYARELREGIEKETGLLIYSSGNMTPEGWAAFGQHLRTRPNPYASALDKPGPVFNSMGFVVSWKDKVPRFMDSSIQYSDEQDEARYANREIFYKFDDKELLWAEE